LRGAIFRSTGDFYPDNPLFTVFEIPEYTYAEFENISTRIVNKLSRSTTIPIATSVWKAGSKVMRDVLKIAKLCNPADTEEDIIRLISTN
jgi:hypothetical protein